MVVKLGNMFVCDRCGEMTFMEKTDDSKAMPDGWDHHYNTGNLCPNCSEEYNELFKGFMQREKK